MKPTHLLLVMAGCLILAIAVCAVVIIFLNDVWTELEYRWRLKKKDVSLPFVPDDIQ